MTNAMTNEQSRIVVKSNRLIEAHYKLSLNAQRLILFAVSGIDSRGLPVRPGRDQMHNIKVTAQEFSRAFDIPENVAYRDLRDATLELFEGAWVEIEGKLTTKGRWVDSVKYHDGQGFAVLSFTRHVWPHLTELRDKFTEYRLGQVAGLRRPYSIRLFEWFIQFSETGWLQVSIEDIKKRLEVSYSRYTDLRRKVVVPAVNELSVKANMDITWTEIKNGRSVVALKFVFRERDQLQLFAES